MNRMLIFLITGSWLCQTCSSISSVQSDDRPLISLFRPQQGVYPDSYLKYLKSATVELVQLFKDYLFVHSAVRMKHFPISDCVYALETNRLASSPCVLSPTCGETHFKEVSSSWYQEKWGICYGTGRFPRLPQKRSFSSMVDPALKAYTFVSPDSFEGGYARVYTLLSQYSKDLLQDLLYIRYPNSIAFIHEYCHKFIYSNTSSEILNRIAINGRDSISYTDLSNADFERYCTPKHFRDEYDLLSYLNLQIGDNIAGPLHSGICVLTDEKFGYAEQDGVLEPILLNCTNTFATQTFTSQFNAHYSNPISNALRSFMHYMLFILEHVISFFLNTFLDVTIETILSVLDYVLLLFSRYDIPILSYLLLFIIILASTTKFVLSCIYLIVTIIVVQFSGHFFNGAFGVSI